MFYVYSARESSQPCPESHTLLKQRLPEAHEDSCYLGVGHQQLTACSCILSKSLPILLSVQPQQYDQLGILSNEEGHISPYLPTSHFVCVIPLPRVTDIWHVLCFLFYQVFSVMTDLRSKPDHSSYDFSPNTACLHLTI